MITYNLACSKGHEFEGWFKDSAAYDLQEADGSLACPVCGSAHVKKAIMAPSVMTSVTKAKGKSVPASPPVSQPGIDPQTAKRFVAGFRKYIEEHADYVGPKFPEEARKIHYGETEERPIYGESTLSEARELIEEGIEVAPMPPDPGELN